MSDTTRRTFLQATAATAASASLLPGAFAAGNDTLKIGLVGCGDRGTGAAKEALRADPNVKLVAMCDAFPDRLEKSLGNMSKIADIAKKIDVTPDRKFDGFDGYKKLIDCVDVVLLCTPPGFRPLHLRAAIEAGKHVFCEKPVAVDVTGAKSVIETARLAKQKNLSLCSGYCWRYYQPMRETVKRVHDGVIGDVSSIHITYLAGSLWHRGNDPKWSPMEYQMRNWYYYTWLSGDFIVEQHCHNFDKVNWVLHGKAPVAAVGVGGRQQRRDPKFGHIYDHFATTLEFAGGLKVHSFCRQMDGTAWDVNDHVVGTKGAAQLMKWSVQPFGGKAQTFEDPAAKSMYQVEHDELFAGIRSGKYINDGENAAHSTLLAILAREAAYTGKRLTWEELLASKQNLAPKEYVWGDIATPAVPMPGVYKLA
ncbi:Gfo/Idh/MocA family oxidoreductase [Gemmata sp. JC717]|uniref:Gfo/Idh/MocA family protein n=1 Tax=Gemmata algarum TaxID=2975278 RepID=UPI0021BA931F|nr:Gfo/Idh/MocA family oxidoreductase [Gemmata algarum]MDY3553319.1 Gfo/Idh/MocA family oxidoreductase [Gemmata algarum]